MGVKAIAELYGLPSGDLQHCETLRSTLLRLVTAYAQLDQGDHAESAARHSLCISVRHPWLGEAHW